MELFSDENMRLVKREARAIGDRFSRLPAGLELQDLIQAGYIGLMKAGRKYDSRRASFRTYASIRIRGEILDEIRALGRESLRRIARDMREIEETKERLEAMNLREATQQDMEHEIPAYYSKEEDVASLTLEGLSEGMLDEHDTEALSHAEREIERLAKNSEKLPPRFKEVFNRYYLYGQPLIEIGRALGVTESRACQILKGATTCLQRSYC